MIKAEILVDTTGSKGDRAITYLVSIPQIVVKELLRHRMFSFSSSSMRAIPFKKVVKDIQENMFKPIAFQKEHKGMQGTEYLDSKNPYYQWETAALEACERAKKLTEIGVTKQLASRIIEPFGYAQILITATEYDNWFSLRCPQYYYAPEEIFFNSKKDFVNKYEECFGENWCRPDVKLWQELNKSNAEIHIQSVAEKMWDCKNENSSKNLHGGQWHIPFLDESLKTNRDKLKISVARCARLSYVNHDGNINHKKDVKLFSDLVADNHWSCAEHQLRVMSQEEYFTYSKTYLCKNIQSIPNEDIGSGKTLLEKKPKNLYKVTEYGWCKNLRGFISYRHILENNL